GDTLVKVGDAVLEVARKKRRVAEATGTTERMVAKVKRNDPAKAATFWLKMSEIDKSLDSVFGKQFKRTETALTAEALERAAEVCQKWAATFRGAKVAGIR